MMENTGSHPDCVHCRFMTREPNGEYRCRQHDMLLHSPVSLFCKQITAKDEQDSDYQHWFAATVDADELNPNTLYTWVETRIQQDNGEVELRIEAEKIAPLTSYISWAAGTFWQVLRSVRITKRETYRQHGYDVLD